MSLIIILGFDGPSGTAKPSLVYVGRSGEEARLAQAADTTSVRFELLKNPVTQRKNNANRTAPSVVESPPAEEAPPAGNDGEQLESESESHKSRHRKK